MEGEGCGASALVLPGGRYLIDVDEKSGTSDHDILEAARALRHAQID